MNVPKLRFKEFDGEWEERYFEELLEAKDGIRRGPFGSALKKEFFVSESDYVVYEQQNAIYNKYTTRYNITKEKYEELIKFNLNPGDFIMSGAGTIGRISKVPKGIKKGVFNQALIRFRINSEITDSEYFLQFMRAEKMQRNLTGANPGSAITNLVPMNELKKWSIIVPDIKEQKKISKFLKAIDKKIQLQQQKIDLLQEQKKGFLQKMFPKAGETQPEIRFDGFTGEWEERKFEDILKEFSIKSKNENEYSVLSSTNRRMEIRDGRVSGISNLGYKIIEDGDLVLSPQNLWLGNININDIGTGLVSPSYKTFKFVNVDIKFVRPQLRTPRMLEEYKNASTQGASVVRRNLELDSFYQIPICIPNENEQNKIGEFFKYLADTIDLHQRKLDLYKAQKQGFMQQMFI